MSNPVTVTINQEYIKMMGNKTLDNTGRSRWKKAQDYTNIVREEVLETEVINEFSHGWRSKFELEVDEGVCKRFVSACTDNLNDEIDVQECRRLIQPIQIPMARRYREEHIQSLRDAPLRYRQRQAEYLTPLIQACSDVLTVNDILSLLLDGVLDSISPLGRHSAPDQIVSGLEEEIVDNEDEIDLNQGYFYQGPKHLGVLPTGKDSNIATCACEYKGGYVFPFLFSEKDPVNKEAMKILEYVD